VNPFSASGFESTCLTNEAEAAEANGRCLSPLVPSPQSDTALTTIHSRLISARAQAAATPEASISPPIASWCALNSCSLKSKLSTSFSPDRNGPISTLLVYPSGRVNLQPMQLL